MSEPLTNSAVEFEYHWATKVGQTFLNFFSGSHRVNNCSESSIVRSDVYFFSQGSTILFQLSVALCSSTSLLRALRLNLGHSNRMFYYTDLTSPYIWSLHWRGQAVSYLVVGVLHKTSGEQICYSISSETIDTAIWSQPLSFHYNFRSDTIFQFFLGKSKVQRICVHF